MFNIAIYVRESRDDNEENYETIETQIKLLTNYVKKNALGKIFNVYIDDNVSGVSFERRGIHELKKDIEEKKVDLVLLKDLSRLGRNNAKTLLFIDFLEELGVRIITYDGKYDSEKDNDTLGIETWFNERYVRDISRKIRANLRCKIECGEYIGKAPYGYKKSSELKNKLVIDETTSSIVKKIYKMYREGYGYKYIADELNTSGVSSPAQVKYGQRAVLGEDEGFTEYINKIKSHSMSNWTGTSIQRILTNRVYTGDTVQGVSEKISFKSKKTRKLPKNKWVITENTHEAIISREEFEHIQTIRKNKQKNFRACNSNTSDNALNKKKTHILSGIIYCGRCGKHMFARKRKNRPIGYICSEYAKYGKQKCSSHFIREEHIVMILVEEILDAINDIKIRNELINLLKNEFENNNTQNCLNSLKKQLEIKKEQEKNVYIDKLNKIISEELFFKIKEDIENQIFNLEKTIKEINMLVDKKINLENYLIEFEKNIKKYGLTHYVVKLMVKRITIYDVGDSINDNQDKECIFKNYEYSCKNNIDINISNVIEETEKINNKNSPKIYKGIEGLRQNKYILIRYAFQENSLRS